MHEGFRDPQLVQKLLRHVEEVLEPPVTLMEVCGTHTVAIFRHGLRRLLPPGLKLLSGPGCPVCVTPDAVIDAAIDIARQPGVVLATFGDMVRVPGSRQSLEELRAEGAQVKVIYSPLEAVTLAEQNPEQEVVFLAVGFETTVPMVAAAVLQAKQKGLANFSLLCAPKTIPGALRALLASPEVRIDGLLCPGHVSAVIGTRPYEFIPREFGIGAVITGFEPVDLLHGIYLLLRQHRDKAPRVENQYRRWVRPGGNPAAWRLVEEVFAPCGSHWRGLGYLEGTGLELREEYRAFDALRRFQVAPEVKPARKGCRCGEVLRGVIAPPECPLFAGACVPERPVGPCMVSVEGTCRAYYTYGR